MLIHRKQQDLTGSQTTFSSPAPIACQSRSRSFSQSPRKQEIFPPSGKWQKSSQYSKMGRRTQFPTTGLQLLTCVSKAYERCIFDQILVIVSGKISPAQFGFRKRRSCVLQLPVSLYKTFDSRDKKISSHALCLDLRKGFDKADHGILIQKLYKMGVSS